jgi:hypothetical protein
MAMAEEFFAVTERMRRATSIPSYVDACCREGVLAAELALLVVPEANARLRAFMIRIAEAANLFDKLVDAQADHRGGELALRPGVWFHLRLAGELMRRLPAAVAAHRRPLALLAWAVPYLRLGWADRSRASKVDAPAPRDRAVTARAGERSPPAETAGPRIPILPAA